MTHVVERCPDCGVEHDVSPAGACEACHEPLRYWCRRHGRDAGWLAGPDCPRCAEEAARPAPRVATEQTVLRGLGPPPALADVPAERPVLRGLGPPPADADVPAPAPPAPGPGHREDPVGALVGGLLLLLLGGTGGGIVGFVTAVIYALASGRGSANETLLEWGMMGALAGFVIAFLLDAVAFFGRQTRPRE
jgi:hypothetical protein